jgi:hypothetical protein
MIILATLHLDLFCLVIGATTLSITTFIIMTLSLKTFSIMTVRKDCFQNKSKFITEYHFVKHMEITIH